MYSLSRYSFFRSTRVAISQLLLPSYKVLVTVSLHPFAVRLTILYIVSFIQDLPSAAGSKEILYRVELPYMEELTLVYLEKEGGDDDNNEELSKSTCEKRSERFFSQIIIFFN